MKYFLAIDIGASSGRHIVGWQEDGELRIKEVYRFPNGVQEQTGHLIWDVDALLAHVKTGIAAAKAEFSGIVSLSIDTWGVDYVLLRGDEEVRPVYAYRDSRTANYSNEGGVGYNRYQKNIMGMWLVNELQKELCSGLGFAEIVNAAKESACDVLIDANAPEFLAPKSMKAAFDGATDGKLISIGDYFRCAYRSLAESYAKALAELERNTGKQYDKLYIVGGGAKNDFLNHLTAKATGKRVVALPIEATALGNLKMQMEADL